MQKCVLLGVSSSIAVYKAVQLTSDLLKKGYDVEVTMTENATKFVAPLTFSTLTKHNTIYQTFDEHTEYDIHHISLAKKVDVFIVAPATANVISKLANGIADDFLTTTFLAFKGPKIIAPAMNTAMYDNPIIQDNIAKLKEYGCMIVEPEVGLLACKDEGRGKLAAIDTLIAAIEAALIEPKTLKGKKVVVTAGPTIEKIDPVRFISNHSSGKMGYAIAKAAFELGAEVTLVSGPTSLKHPYGVKTISVSSANEMLEAMKKVYPDSDYVIMAAAVADYRIEDPSDIKIKKSGDDMSLHLVRNPDILAYLGENKKRQKLCGFAMETNDVIENARVKFLHKNCDMLVVNDLNEKGAGFKVDTNIVSIITADNIEKMPLMSKDELAMAILRKLGEL